MPSRYGEDSANTQDEDQVDQNQGDGGTVEKQPRSNRYDLRTRNRVYCSAAGLPDNITTEDEPSLKEAFASTERSNWMSAIHEEFNHLADNGT